MGIFDRHPRQNCTGNGNSTMVCVDHPVGSGGVRRDDVDLCLEGNFGARGHLAGKKVPTGIVIKVLD